MSCYSITINDGDPFDPEDVGLVLESRSQLSLNQGVVQTRKGFAGSVATGPVFSTNDAVAITKDSQPWFVGTAGPAIFTRNGWQQVLRDPWNALETSTLATPPEEGLVGGDMDWTFSLATYWAEMARRAAAADYQPVKTEVLFCDWPEGLDDFLTMRHAFGPVGRFSEIAQRILTLHPSAGTWWDYSTTPPTLQIGYQGSDICTVAFDSVTIESLVKRDDLWPAFAQFLVTTNAVVDGGGLGGYSYLEIGEQFGVQVGRWPLTGASATGRGVATGTISIAEVSGTWIRTSAEDHLVFDWLRSAIWEGSVSMSIETLEAAGLKPGKTLRISGGRAEWSTMNAVIQEVTEDLSKGTASVRLGMHSIRDAQSGYDFLFEAAQVYRFNRAWNVPKLPV